MNKLFSKIKDDYSEVNKWTVSTKPELEYQMESAARNLHFEKAIELRDKLKKLKER
jgi:excinuclease UvrABC helicase subunit UvrB